MLNYKIGWKEEIPEEITETIKEDEGFLQSMYEVLMKRQVVEGQMICPCCERVYDIKNGIANMLLTEDEV